MAKKQAIHSQKDLELVQDHYLDYPYPMRNPEDEKQRLLGIHGERLEELNHFLFQGKETFNDNFRVLVAGGGTGDCSTYMGEQLKNNNAEVVYLDFSTTSLNIAKARAEARGLRNIKFINESIFNIPKLNLGKFDYINCSGVLHHLSSPDEGLAILKNCLKPSGGMGLMVYAKYGRTAIYQVQDLMKIINEDASSRQKEVENAKIILNSMPPTNWYMRSRDLIQDVENYGDIGIYDLFLHKQDRCYSIPELYEFIEKPGLNFVEFMEIRPRMKLKIENYIKDQDLLAHIKRLPLAKQQAIAEIITGDVIKHTIYLSNITNSVASCFEEDNIPFFHEITNLSTNIKDYLQNNQTPPGVIFNFNFKKSWIPDGVSVNIMITKFTLSFFEAIGEGNEKTIGEIIDEIHLKHPESTRAEILADIKVIMDIFIECSLLLLRRKQL
ncbi:MAG: class I SAM-dependent methyltransferase [Rickettsiaceae bacterium]|nr:class I SAM-dependent methyltransferase [Rickettsiaceae bacterium]